MVNNYPTGCTFAMCFRETDAKILVGYLAALQLWSNEAWILCGPPPAPPEKK